MELIRGWEAQYTPGVTGGLRLRKASEYRAMEDDEGVGDMREGQLRVATMGRVSRAQIGDGLGYIPDLDVIISSERDDSESVVEDLRLGEIREFLYDCRVEDSASDSPFLLCLSREPLTMDVWKSMQSALPDRYDTWTTTTLSESSLTEELASLRFEIEHGIKRWLGLNGITEHKIRCHWGWVNYSYGKTPPPLEPDNVVVEALHVGRWFQKSREYRDQQEYRIAWYITGPQVDRLPDVIDIELTKTGLGLFAPWSPPAK